MREQRLRGRLWRRLADGRVFEDVTTSGRMVLRAQDDPEVVYEVYEDDDLVPRSGRDIHPPGSIIPVYYGDRERLIPWTLSDFERV